MWETIIAILLIGGILSVIVEFIEYIFPLLILGAVALAIRLISKAAAKKENARIASVADEVSSVIAHYTPNKIALSFTANEYRKDEHLNIEATGLVAAYKEQMAEAFAACEAAGENIEEILACKGCASPDEKLEYLNKSKYELERLKIECDKCFRKAESRKIKIICGNGGKTQLINEAALALLASKKCHSASEDVKTFVTDKKPAELMLFRYEQEPATFAIDGFYFCVFSNIILVFDENGVFSAALHASAFRVTVERKKTKYRYDKNVDSDSAAITFEEERAKWLHERKDGHRDMRYKDNRLIEYTVPVSGYEYGIIAISIGSHYASFSISSSAALTLFEHIGNSFAESESIADIMCTEEIEQAENEPASLPLSPETKNRR